MMMVIVVFFACYDNKAVDIIIWSFITLLQDFHQYITAYPLPNSCKTNSFVWSIFLQLSLILARLKLLHLHLIFREFMVVFVAQTTYINSLNLGRALKYRV